MENSEVLLLQDGHSFPSETFTFPLIISGLEQDDQLPLWKCQIFPSTTCEKEVHFILYLQILQIHFKQKILKLECYVTYS